MKERKNIILVGLMGSGKTTVGKQLSKTLSKKFIDTDHLIEQRTGVDISTIFELEGEDGFRLRETHLLEGLLNQKDLVIASGGGIILSQLNRKLLKKLGLVFYLKANCDDLTNRLKNDKSRPLIKNVDIRIKMQDLLNERDTLYDSVADYIIETKGKRAIDIKNEIMEIII